MKDHIKNPEELLRNQIIRCVGCARKCEVHKLASYINEIKLEEFVEQQRNQEVPREILRILKQVWFSNGMRIDYCSNTYNHTYVYDVLKPKSKHYIGKTLSTSD